MKKLFAFIALFFLMTVNLNAQSISLSMPEWKNQDCPNGGMRFNGITFDGHRTSTTKSQNYSKDGYYHYRTLKPLLIKITDIPSDVKNVNVSIDGDFVAIVNAPKGTEFFDKNHAKVPVLSASQNVVVENPVIFKYKFGKEVFRGCNPNDYEIKNMTFSEFVKSKFYYKDETQKEEIIDQTFSISSGDTYIVVVATEKGRANMVVSDVNSSANDKTVIGQLKFTDGNDVDTCWNGVDYALELAARPVNSPIQFTNVDEKCPTTQFEVDITNKGGASIDLSEVMVVFAPKTKWCDKKNECIIANNNEQGKSELRPGEIVTVKTDYFTIDDKTLKNGLNVKTMQVKILYPTSPEHGKTTEADVTINNEFVSGNLAGIGSKFEKFGGSVYRYVFNTSPDKEALLSLDIKTIPDCDCSSAGRRVKWHKDNAGKMWLDLYGGDNYSFGYVKRSGTILLKYLLYENGTPREFNIKL